MHFEMRKPCGDCPFRRKGGIRLRSERVDEVGGNMLSFAGVKFPCHKHVHGKARRREVDREHCVGALIFAEKNDTATQAMRIAERLGLYDARKLMAPENKDVHDFVFDTLDEMREANERMER